MNKTTVPTDRLEEIVALADVIDQTWTTIDTNDLEKVTMMMNLSQLLTRCLHGIIN